MTLEEDVLKAINQKVKECMRKPVTAFPSTPVSSLIYDMVKDDIGAIIVIEKERPVGIITEKDVLEKVITKNKDVYKTTAEEIMSKPIITIESDRSLREALDLLQEHQIRRLAVIEKDMLIGIVTERRLLAKFLNQIY